MDIFNLSLSIFAICISFTSLLISVQKYRLSIPKLHYTVDEDYSRYIGFIWYEHYQLAIVKMFICNSSEQSIDIESISLTYNGKEYFADTCSLSDDYNSDGITLFSKGHEKMHCIYLNISSENLLNNRRINSYGTSSGFAVFYDFPQITSPVFCTLTLTFPNRKKYKKAIMVHPLDDDFHPIHPLK